MNQKQRALVEIHLAVLLFGLSGLFAKFLLLDAIVIVFGRVLFATLALWIALSYYKVRLSLKSKKDYRAFALLGVLLAVHWSAFFYSVQISTVAIGVITFSTFPIFAVFLEPLFLKEKLHRKDIALAVITFIGVALVIPSYDIGSNLMQGALWGLLSGASFAVLAILNRKYVRGYSSITIALYQDAVAMIVLLPFVFFLHPTVTANDLWLLALLGIVFTALAHSLFIKGMTHIKTKTASVIASLESVYGILFAALLLSEVPSMKTVIGGAIVLGASLVASLASTKE